MDYLSTWGHFAYRWWMIDISDIFAFVDKMMICKLAAQVIVCQLGRSAINFMVKMSIINRQPSVVTPIFCLGGGGINTWRRWLFAFCGGWAGHHTATGTGVKEGILNNFNLIYRNANIGFEQFMLTVYTHCIMDASNDIWQLWETQTSIDKD